MSCQTMSPKLGKKSSSACVHVTRGRREERKVAREWERTGTSESEGSGVIGRRWDVTAVFYK